MLLPLLVSTHVPHLPNIPYLEEGGVAVEEAHLEEEEVALEEEGVALEETVMAFGACLELASPPIELSSLFE